MVRRSLAPGIFKNHCCTNGLKFAIIKHTLWCCAQRRSCSPHREELWFWSEWERNDAPASCLLKSVIERSNSPWKEHLHSNRRRRVALDISKLLNMSFCQLTQSASLFWHWDFPIFAGRISAISVKQTNLKTASTIQMISDGVREVFKRRRTIWLYRWVSNNAHSYQS